MTVTDIAELLGGTGVLGRSVGSDLELDTLVEVGLPSRSVQALMRHMEIGTAEMAALIPTRTLSASLRRPRLSSEQSDRVARLARIFGLAEETFGSPWKARVWILRPNRNFGGRAPLELVRRSSGSLMVEQALGRLAHGVFTRTGTSAGSLHPEPAERADGTGAMNRAPTRGNRPLSR